MSKIDEAAEATKQIEVHAAEAARILREGLDGRIMVNFYGGYTSPRDRAVDLRSARERIDKALALLEATRWPTQADYDRL